MKSALLLAFIILSVALGFFYLAIPDCLQHEAACFGGGDLAPFRYRVLQTGIEYLFVPSGNHQQILAFDFAAQAFLTALFFVGLWHWLGADMRALCGCALCGVLMLLSFHYWFRSVSSLFEASAVVWGCLCLSRMRRLQPSSA